MASWNKFQDWISRFFAYPTISHKELKHSHEEGKIQDTRVKQLIRFRRRVFVVVLLILTIYLLIEYL